MRFARFAVSLLIWKKCEGMTLKCAETAHMQLYYTYNGTFTMSEIDMIFAIMASIAVFYLN